MDDVRAEKVTFTAQSETDRNIHGQSMVMHPRELARYFEIGAAAERRERGARQSAFKNASTFAVGSFICAFSKCVLDT